MTTPLSLTEEQQQAAMGVYAAETARYPATLDWVLSTSRLCARVIRGTASSARAVTPSSARVLATSGCAAGPSIATSTASLRSALISLVVGVFTAVTMSLAQTSLAAATEAPAST